MNVCIFFIFSYLTALTYYRKEKENTTITKKHMHDLLMYGLIPCVSSLMRPRELGCLSEVAQGNEVRRDAVRRYKPALDQCLLCNAPAGTVLHFVRPSVRPSNGRSRNNEMGRRWQARSANTHIYL